MRTRRAFRPVVEFMPRLDLPSTILPGRPTAPVVIPRTPPPTPSNPSDPILVTDPEPYEEPYAGPDTPSPMNPAPTGSV